MLTFENMTMELNVSILKNNPWDLMMWSTLLLIGWVNFLLEGVEFDHEEELMSCVYESFCMGYEPEFEFEEQYHDSLHPFILAPFPFFPSPSHEALPSVPLSSSLELKPLLNTLKYASLDLNEIFLMIIVNNLNPYQETQVLDLLRENQEAIGWTLGGVRGINPTIVQHQIHLRIMPSLIGIGKQG